MIVTKFAMKKNNRPQNNGKNRGYYQNIYDKYMNAAKECNVSGDKVMAEYNMQHAEHYLRLINERFPVEKKHLVKDEANQTCTIQVTPEQPLSNENPESTPDSGLEEKIDDAEGTPVIENKKRRCIRRKTKNEENMK